MPRDESYREDVETARGHRRDPADLYRNLRAAAESGWDFSSRWLADGHSLNTIRTVSLLPVDLNSLMAHLEQTIAKSYRIKGDIGRSSQFADLAARREAAIQHLMWNGRSGIFTDYDWRKREATSLVGAAGRIYPALPAYCDVPSSRDYGSDRAPAAADGRRRCNDADDQVVSNGITLTAGHRCNWSRWSG